MNKPHLPMRSVKLQNHTFKNRGEALQHFRSIKNDMLASGEIYLKGDVSDLAEIFIRYRDLEPQDLDDIVGFRAGYTAKKTPKGIFNSCCFFVVYRSGFEKDFSIKKALNKIAE